MGVGGRATTGCISDSHARCWCRRRHGGQEVKCQHRGKCGGTESEAGASHHLNPEPQLAPHWSQRCPGSKWPQHCREWSSLLCPGFRCTHVPTAVYMCAHSSTRTCVPISLSASVWPWLYVSMHLHIPMCSCLCTCGSMCICVFVTHGSPGPYSTRPVSTQAEWSWALALEVPGAQPGRQ